MKLPRWLSPVRTVEAETGWPRALCKRFASHVEYHRFWLHLLVWSLISAALIWPWFQVAGWLLHRLLTRDELLEAPWVVAPGIFILPPPIFLGAAGLLVYRRRTLRATRAFLAEPWCLNCRYPIPAAAPGAETPAEVCPECGEPIPPEIAGLAAEQKAGSA